MASSSVTTWGRRPCRHQPGLPGHHGADRSRRHDQHGAATAISFQQGARNFGLARQALVNAFWLLGLLGAVAPLLLHYWHVDILQALGIEQGTDTWQQASDYLYWIGGGTLLLACNLAVPYLLRNDGRPVSPCCW